MMKYHTQKVLDSIANRRLDEAQVKGQLQCDPAKSKPCRNACIPLYKKCHDGKVADRTNMSAGQRIARNVAIQVGTAAGVAAGMYGLSRLREPALKKAKEVETKIERKLTEKSRKEKIRKGLQLAGIGIGATGAIGASVLGAQVVRKKVRDNRVKRAFMEGERIKEQNQAEVNKIRRQIADVRQALYEERRRKGISLSGN